MLAFQLLPLSSACSGPKQGDSVRCFLEAWEAWTQDRLRPSTPCHPDCQLRESMARTVHSTMFYAKNYRCGRHRRGATSLVELWPALHSARQQPLDAPFH